MPTVSPYAKANGTTVKKYGWAPKPFHTGKFVAGLGHRKLPSNLVSKRRKQDVLLWKAKDVAQPNWVRIAQEIGDCVSHGLELACTCILWNEHAKGNLTFEAPVSANALYGLLRVEIHGGPQMGYSEDGAAGSWGAEAVNKYGVLLMKDYSKETGNKEHNLTEYSGKKASDFGYYGCGGQNDRGLLDDIARLYPVQDVAPIHDPDEAEAALAAGCPISIASMVGFEGNRDENGIIQPRGQWPHQMCILGVKWLDDQTRLFRIFNSWNGSVKGPDPGIDDKRVSECSWWVTDRAMTQILRDQDTFCYSNVKGFTQQLYDFDTNLLV